MKKIKVIPILLTIILLLNVMNYRVKAEESFQYNIKVSTNQIVIGNEFDISLSLSNYADISKEIRGLQIDITNIDTSILEVISHKSLVQADNVASNKTSYQTAKKMVRYVFADFSGYLDKSVKDIMTFKLKVKEDVKTTGSITLPVTIKISTMDRQNITLKDNIIINYVTPSHVDVNISWGSMEFIYDDGVWNAENHSWENTGWKVVSDNSNMISVTNNGNEDINVKMKFTPNNEMKNLTGVFKDKNGTEIQFPLLVKQEEKSTNVWFFVNGSLDNRWTDKYNRLGSITISLN